MVGLSMAFVLTITRKTNLVLSLRLSGFSPY
jgi:hypothetical protein